MAVSVDAKTLGVVKIFIGAPSNAAARTQFAALPADQKLVALQQLQSDAKYGSKIAPALNGLFSDPSMGTAARQLHAQLFAAASTNIPDNIAQPLAGISRDVADIARSIGSLKTSFDEPNGIKEQMEKAKELAAKAKSGIESDPDLAGDDDLKAAASQYGAVILEIDNALLYLDSLSSELAKMLEGVKEAVTNQEEYLFDDQLLENKLQPASGNIEKRFGSANKSLNLAERIKQFVGMIKSLAAAQLGALVGTYNGAARASIQLKETNHENVRTNEEKKIRHAGSKAALADAGASDAELAKIDGKIAALTRDNDAMSAQEQEIDSRINGFGQKLDIAVKSATDLSSVIVSSHDASLVNLRDELLELIKDGEIANKTLNEKKGLCQYSYCTIRYVAGDVDSKNDGHINVDPDQIPEAVKILDAIAKSPAIGNKITSITFTLAHTTQFQPGKEDEAFGNYDRLALNEPSIRISVANPADLDVIYKALTENSEWQALDHNIRNERKNAAANPYKTDGGVVFYSLAGAKAGEPPKAGPRTKMFEQVWQELAGINANNFGDVMKAEAGKDTGSIKAWLEGIQKILQAETIGNVPIANAYSNFAERIMSFWKSRPDMTANVLVANIEAMILAVAFHSIRSYLKTYPSDEIIKGDPQDQARVKALAGAVEVFLQKQRFGDVQGKDLFKDLAAQIIAYYEATKATVKSDELKKQILIIILGMMDKKSKESGLSINAQNALNYVLEGFVPKKSGVVI